MLSNLLVTSTEFYQALLNAGLGFSVVVTGIAFLIFVVWLVGLIMSKAKGEKTKAPKTNETEQEQEFAVTSQKEDVPDEETVAVITAALMAYYQTNNPKCEFVVKRIKRI